MEMRKLFSNSGAEINRKEMVQCRLYVFIECVGTITNEPIYS